MPVVIDKRRSRGSWGGAHNRRSTSSAKNHAAKIAALNVALINNMPDSALEDTELQFSSLLSAASGDAVVCLKLYSLPGIERKGRARERLTKSYFGVDDLWNSRFDGVIITGTEPLRSNLREETYWHTLVDIFDWAERNTASTALSCLAAHASVLHSDGIERRGLTEKRFGIFAEKKISDHPLIQGAGGTMQFPHSRWNEIPEDALTSAGYSILTKSDDAGVNLFVKKKRESVFLHFQGHPEYGVRTLLKEYRRDVTRYLKRERETYPAMPKGYFDGPSTKLLNDFREKALRQKDKHIMWQFPEEAVVDRLQDSWRAAATCVYRNWLKCIASKKTDGAAYAPVPSVAVR